MRPEQSLQLHVSKLFTLAGAVVFDFSQGYRHERGGTRQTPGIADLWSFCPPIKRGWWFEVKTPEGLAEHFKLAPLLIAPNKSSHRDWLRAQAQARFGQLCRDTDVPYGIGGIAEAWQLLESLGLAAWQGSMRILTLGRRIHAPTARAS